MNVKTEEKKPNQSTEKPPEKKVETAEDAKNRAAVQEHLAIMAKHYTLPGNR